MASYDDYDGPTRQRSTRRSYYREERREDPRDPYLSVQSRDLVPQHRADSDLSVEEVRRDFPPPGYSSRDIRRARSAEGGYYDDRDDRRGYYGRERYYDRDYDRDYDRYERDSERPRSHRKSSHGYYEEEEQKKVRMLSKQEQIIAAITGAALAIGGKEVYDRREASQHGSEIQRNVLASAALGAAGAFAGYQGAEFYNKHKEKDAKKLAHRGYYSEDEEDGKEKKSNKNFLESALAAAGLGGAIKALGGKSDKDDKSDTRSTRSDKSDKGKGDGKNKIQKAAMASLIAGATEAFRISKEPGGWKGEKAKRVFTAAAGAATIDAAQKSEKAGSKMGLAESVIGGLVGNRVINGSKKNIEEDTKTGRSRSRSRAGSVGGGGGSGLAALATAGLGALGAKKLYDHHEEKKEEERSRSRRPRSRDSYDSRDGSPDRRHRSRSRSVVDKVRGGMAKLGFGNGPSDDERDDRNRDRRDRSRRRSYDDDYDDPPRGSRRHREHRRDDYSDDDRDYRQGGGRKDDYDSDQSDRSRRGSRVVTKRRDRSRSRAGSESDLGDSETDKKQTRKMRGKLILTSGFAAVATIHAGHNVYQSMHKRQTRAKALREGKITAEEAEKLKNRAILQDVASVGVAALGIKGAISEIKEVAEEKKKMAEWNEMRRQRHERRLARLRQLKNGDGYGYDLSGRQRADIWYSGSSPPGRST